MTLFSVATIPGLLILFFVYRKDPVEKEPLKLLLSLFALGCISTIPAVILELLGTFILFGDERPTSLIGMFLDNFIVIALVEELCKFFFLRLKTWKSHEFNYLFDGIVYAVFVSLGFAVLENIFYVLEFGIETGIARAFTSLPGHTVFAVFMGFFYAHAKLEQVKGNNGGVKRNLTLAIVVPTIAHGAYDFLASIESDAAFLLFLALITVMFIYGLYLIFRESKAAVCLFTSNPVANPVEIGMRRAPTDPRIGAIPTQTSQICQVQCPNCRSWIVPGGHFCQNCGIKID